jgi:hypothetical protein
MCLQKNIIEEIFVSKQDLRVAATGGDFFIGSIII